MRIWQSAVTSALLALGVVACENPQSALEKAQEGPPDRVAFQSIIDRFPDSEAAKLASAYIAEMEAWDEARATREAEAITAFAEAHPDGLFHEEAAALLADIGAWQSARAKNAIELYEAYLADRPQGAFAAEAQERVDALKPRVDEIAALEAQLAENPDRANELVPRLERMILSFVREEGPGVRYVVPGIRASGAPPTKVTIEPIGQGLKRMNTEFPGDELSFGLGAMGLNNDPLGSGSIHRYKGVVSDGGFRFTSTGGRAQRLTFGVLRGAGYVYLRGQGSVRNPQGEEVQLGG